MEDNMEMNIYLIPITENSIFIGNMSLWEYTSKYYPLFKTLEDERVGIIYSTPILNETNEQRIARERRYQLHQEYTKECAKNEGIPLYIIALGDGLEAREFITNVKLVALSLSALGVRKVDPKELSISDDYEDSIKRFLSYAIAENNNEKITYTVREFKFLTDIKEKLKVAFGVLKDDIDLDDDENVIKKIWDSNAIESSILFMAKYNLSFDDFFMLLKYRLMNKKISTGELKSAFMEELDDIILLSGILKKSTDRRTLFLDKKEST